MNVLAWVVIATLILFNGLFVAAEFAAVSVRRNRIRQLAEGANRRARRLLPTLDEPRLLDRYIAACQVGITISSLVLGAFGQATFSRSLVPLFQELGSLKVAAAHSASAVVVLVGLTALQMVLGELVPKSLALQYPTRVSLFTVVPMAWAQRLLSWFIVVLNGSGWVVLRLIGVEPLPHRNLHSADEIRYLLAESREGGHLSVAEERRLSHALGLTQRTARDLMVPRARVVAVDEAAGLAGAVAVAAESQYTRLPVYQESLERVVGLVDSKDLAAVWLAREIPEEVGDVGEVGEGGASDGPRKGDDAGDLDDLLRPILTVHERITADRVLALMREQHGVMAVVVNDHGGTSGIITAEDILSQLLGEQADEFQREDPTPERLADGRVRMPGDLPLHDASAWVGVAWEGRADTAGGLVMEILGRVPREGDELVINGVEVRVERMEHRAVRVLLARPLRVVDPDADPEPDLEGDDAAVVEDGPSGRESVRADRRAERPRESGDGS